LQRYNALTNLRKLGQRRLREHIPVPILWSAVAAGWNDPGNPERS
jgi:hypothetical protein